MTKLWKSAAQMGQAIKEAAHKALSKKLSHAELLARGLISLGELTHEEGLIGLGEMALGNALRFQLRACEDGQSSQSGHFTFCAGRMVGKCRRAFATSLLLGGASVGDDGLLVREDETNKEIFDEPQKIMTFA